MTRKLIIETYFTHEEQNFYYLMLPGVTDKGFYRAVSSFNAFFNSTRNPKANVTSVRQFTALFEYEIELEKLTFKYLDIDWDHLKTFDSVWDFFQTIGYDYKSRKYRSGERMKRWKDGVFR